MLAGGGDVPHAVEAAVERVGVVEGVEGLPAPHPPLPQLLLALAVWRGKGHAHVRRRRGGEGALARGEVLLERADVLVHVAEPARHVRQAVLCPLARAGPAVERDAAESEQLPPLRLGGVDGDDLGAVRGAVGGALEQVGRHVDHQLERVQLRLVALCKLVVALRHPRHPRANLRRGGGGGERGEGAAGGAAARGRLRAHGGGGRGPARRAARLELERAHGGTLLWQQPDVLQHWRRRVRERRRGGEGKLGGGGLVVGRVRVASSLSLALAPGGEVLFVGTTLGRHDFLLGYLAALGCVLRVGARECGEARAAVGHVDAPL